MGVRNEQALYLLRLFKTGDAPAGALNEEPFHIELRIVEYT